MSKGCKFTKQHTCRHTLASTKSKVFSQKSSTTSTYCVIHFCTCVNLGVVCFFFCVSCLVFDVCVSKWYELATLSLMLSWEYGSVVQNIGIIGTLGTMVLGSRLQTHVLVVFIVRSSIFPIVYSCLQNSSIVVHTHIYDRIGLVFPLFLFVIHKPFHMF